MAQLIYSAIASADGYVEDAAGSFDWAAPGEDLTGNDHRMEGNNQPPRAAWPLGQAVACGDTVSAGDSSGSSG